MLDGPHTGEDDENAAPKNVQCSSCVGGGYLVQTKAGKVRGWKKLSGETLAGLLLHAKTVI